MRLVHFSAWLAFVMNVHSTSLISCVGVPVNENRVNFIFASP